MSIEQEILAIINQIPAVLEKAFIDAWVQRHPGHASQKPHGRRYGAKGEVLPKGHKRKDVVRGGGKGKAAESKTTKKDFPKGDAKSLSSLYKDYGEQCLNLNEPGCVALNAYTSFNYETINGNLRKNKKLTGEDKRTVEEMDKIINEAPRTNADMTVKRSISPDTFKKLMQEGTVFEDKAFTSTTVGDSVDVGALNLEIRIPKGSKGIYVASLSEYPDEKEFLLPRGSQFKVASVSNGKAILELVS